MVQKSLWLSLLRLKTLISSISSTSTSCHLKVFTISRDFPNLIPEILSSFPHTRINPDANSKVSSDIDRFIDFEIDDLSTYREYPDALRLHVKRSSRTERTVLSFR